jgi:hypothetical protein
VRRRCRLNLYQSLAFPQLKSQGANVRLYQSLAFLQLKSQGANVLIIIIAHNDLLYLSKLAHLAPEILIESIKVVLQLTGIHLILGVVGGVLVKVGEEDGLAVGGLDVFARTAVAVSAGADFVVEGAVYFVGFSAKD